MANTQTNTKRARADDDASSTPDDRALLDFVLMTHVNGKTREDMLAEFDKWINGSLDVPVSVIIEIAAAGEQGKKLSSFQRMIYDRMSPAFKPK